MTDLFSHRTTLGQVRVRLPEGTDSDVHRWRWLAQEALSQVQLVPAGLPPQAILIVRYVPDPQPGVLFDADQGGGVRRWSTSAQDHLAACWRRAARPAHEVVSGNVDAVWFADVAEWMACLSWDILSGQAYDRWWWQTWLKQSLSTDLSAMLYHLWSDEIYALPQAVALLHQQHGVSALVAFNQMQAQQVIALHETLLTNYEIELPRNRDSLTATLMAFLSPPQRSLVTMLPAEQAAFVALALVIAEHPTALHVIRHDGFAAVADDALPPIQDDAVSSQDEIDGSIKRSQRASNTDPHDAPLPNASHADDLVATTDVHAAPASQDEQASSNELTETSQRMTDDRVDDDGDDVPAATPVMPVSITDHDDDLPSSQTDYGDLLGEREALLFAAQGGIRTEIGGVWYLVNVLSDLNWLYHPDFAALNPYHKLWALARHWIGDDYDDDPLWAILAELARDELLESLAIEWLNEALPVIHELLIERLDNPDDFLAALTDNATLYVTRTHVDIVFSLEQIRLELRLAGLDRNPGWVAELGRIITLHYE